MPIRFECDSCGVRIKVPDGAEGKKVKCPSCGISQRVPLIKESAPVIAAPSTVAPPVEVITTPAPAPIPSPTKLRAESPRQRAARPASRLSQGETKEPVAPVSAEAPVAASASPPVVAPSPDVEETAAAPLQQPAENSLPADMPITAGVPVLAYEESSVTNRPAPGDAVASDALVAAEAAASTAPPPESEPAPAHEDGPSLPASESLADESPLEPTVTSVSSLPVPASALAAVDEPIAHAMDSAVEESAARVADAPLVESPTRSEPSTLFEALATHAPAEAMAMPTVVPESIAAPWQHADLAALAAAAEHGESSPPTFDRAGSDSPRASDSSAGEETAARSDINTLASPPPSVAKAIVPIRRAQPIPLSSRPPAAAASTASTTPEEPEQTEEPRPGQQSPAMLAASIPVSPPPQVPELAPPSAPAPIPVARVRARAAGPSTPATAPVASRETQPAPAGGRASTALFAACWALRVLAFLSLGSVVKLCLAWSDAGARFIDIFFALPLGIGLVVMFWTVGEIAGALRDRD